MWGRLLTFVGLHELTVNKDAILHRPQTREKQFAFLLDRDVMFLVDADHQIVAFGKTQRCNPKIADGGLPVDFDFQGADELVEGKIDAMLFVDANGETKLHLDSVEQDPVDQALLKRVMHRAFEPATLLVSRR